MQLLSIWLHLHPAVNTIQSNPFSNSHAPVFSQSFVEEFIVQINSLYKERYPNKVEELQIKSTSVRAICMGFFITANETWDQLFRKEDKIDKKGFSLFQGMTQKIEQSFQPLMVVTEQISNIFGRKKVKR